MSVGNDVSIPKLLLGKKTIIKKYALDSGQRICVDNVMVEYTDPFHPSFALQFPFHIIRMLENQQPDVNNHFHCPSCFDIARGIKSRIVEHVMKTHVCLNTLKFLEKLFWYNRDSRLIKEKFGLSEGQINNIRGIGNLVRKMNELLAMARDALDHAQKAKIILGTEILDMVATRTRQQALVDIIKNGLSECDALEIARTECKRYEADHPDCTFNPLHLESVHVRKSPTGGASPVKIDVFIEGIDTSTHGLKYSEVREIRAKAVKKGCATPIAEMLCGEAAAVLLTKGMLSKFVIACDMTIPFWNHLAHHQIASSFRHLRLGKEWHSRIPIEILHSDGYATTLADGMHVWIGFKKRGTDSYNVQIEMWEPGKAGILAEPVRSTTFVLEFHQLPRSVIQYNAIAEQVVTIFCALCGVRRAVEMAEHEPVKLAMKQLPWVVDYEAFEQHVSSISGSMVTPIDKVADKGHRVVHGLDTGIIARDTPVKRCNAVARLLDNQWTAKLLLRLWPQTLEGAGYSPLQARAVVERAFLATGINSNVAIAHLNAPQARRILITIQTSRPDGQKKILREIISMLKDRYLPVYHATPYVPFTQRVGDKTIVGPNTPTQEILIGLETVAVEALGLLRRGIKVGKIKGGGVQKHWNMLHGLLSSEPRAFDAVREALDWLIDLA